MITKEEMKRFLNWPAEPQNRILSIYLNIEPSGDAVLHRRFEAAFKLLIQSLEKETSPTRLSDLKKDVRRARRFISDFQPNGQGLVLFVDDSEDFIWAKELKIHAANQAYWLEKPYILPLLEAFDEYERYGVILADKTRARVFTYYLGEIEEEKGAVAWNDVRHFKTTGKDNLRSAFKLQRTTEMHEEWHLKHVAELMKDLASRRHFDRLILSGPKEAIDELYDLLPRDLQRKVAGRLSLPVDVHEKELLESLTQLENQIEREKEINLVQKLLQTNPSNNHRALGLDATLIHLDKGLIHTLIYSETFHPKGSKCRECGYLYSNGCMMCGRCKSPVDSLPNLLEEMARRIILAGGNIEEVKGDAARKLDEAGGIGAVLKDKSKR